MGRWCCDDGVLSMAGKLERGHRAAARTGVAALESDQDQGRSRVGAKRDNVPRAVAFMMLSAILIPLLNASSKYLTQFYPVVEITWARYAGHFAFMVLVFAPRRGARLLVSSRPVLQLLRSTLLCLSSLIYISALTWVALPTATAISFTGPMIVTAHLSCSASALAGHGGSPLARASSAPL
jgi:hypothetical protein